MELLLSDSALSDLKEIKSFYHDQGVPNVALEHIKTVLSKAENLLTHPGMGRVVPEFNEPNIRELIVNPYRVVYLQGKDYIQIIRVWISKRIIKTMMIN